MNANTITEKFTTRHVAQPVPTTSRGRALFTIDWFLNGNPALRNHDNPQIGIANISSN